MASNNTITCNASSNNSPIQAFTKASVVGVVTSFVLGFIGVPPSISSKVGLGTTALLMKSEGISIRGKKNEKSKSKSK